MLCAQNQITVEGAGLGFSRKMLDIHVQNKSKTNTK